MRYYSSSFGETPQQWGVQEENLNGKQVEKQALNFVSVGPARPELIAMLVKTSLEMAHTERPFEVCLCEHLTREQVVEASLDGEPLYLGQQAGSKTAPHVLCATCGNNCEQAIKAVRQQEFQEIVTTATTSPCQAHYAFAISV